jgi:hypothetical protein
VALSASPTFGVTLDDPDPDGYSQLHASGPLDPGGSRLSLTLGFTPAVGDCFTLLSTDDSSPVTSTFAGLDEGVVFSQNGMMFPITLPVRRPGRYRGADPPGLDQTLVLPVGGCKVFCQAPARPPAGGTNCRAQAASLRVSAGCGL